MKLTAKARAERTRKAAKAKAGAAAATLVAGAQGEASTGSPATESPLRAARRMGWHEGYQQGADEARKLAEDTRIAEFANLGRHYEANGVADDKIIVVNLSVGTIKAIGARLSAARPSMRDVLRMMMAHPSGEWRQASEAKAT